MRALRLSVAALAVAMLAAAPAANAQIAPRDSGRGESAVGSARQVTPPASVDTLRKDVETLRKDLDAFKAGQAAVQTDLQLIKALLQRLLAQASSPAAAAAPTPGAVAAPANLAIPVPQGTWRGDGDASLALIEFSDFECPFCGRFATDIYPQIERDYIKEGRLRYMFVDDPIEQMHPNAFKAHEAALCAGEQGKYWEMHARLFANQKSLAPDALLFHAEAIGADGAKLQECLSAGRSATRVRENVAAARQAGVRGTPTFLIGVVERGQFRAKRVLAGAQPYTVFKDAIDGVLTGK
jgi:protein-disulfide isomerase